MKRIFCVLVLCASAAQADGLRPLRTNRPSRSEGPQTVNSGHLQVEMDFANYLQDHFADVDAAGSPITIKQEIWSVGGTSLRYGLDSHWELQATVIPYMRQTFKGPGVSQAQSGLSDTVLAAKTNFAGNDAGDFAWGAMAYAVIPTSSSRELGERHVQPGGILPVAYSLSGTDSIGAMMKLQRTRASDDSRWATVLGTSVCWSHSFNERIGAFLEFYRELYDDHSDAAVYGDTGVTYLIHPDLQVDLAGSFALNKAAADFNIFSGIARRF